MPRICFILPKYAKEFIGGAEQQVLYLAKELLQRGWDIFYIRETDAPDANQDRDGIQLYGLPKRRFFFRLLNHRKLGRLMSEIRADIWYCRASKGYISSVTVHAKKLGGTVVWACAHDRETGPLVPRAKHPFAKILERLNHAVFVKTLPKVDVRLVQHSGQQKALEQHYHLDSFILGNAHPFPELKIIQRTPLVLWIGNMRPFKQPELFLSLAEKFRRKSVRFVMVGEIYGLALRKKIEAFEKNAPNFEYRGPLPLDEVEPLIWQAKALINTSIEEGFPNTFIQSWLRGCPVVSLQVDPENLIQTHALGFVSGSLEKMSVDLAYVLEDGRHWIDLSSRCRLFAETYFDIRKYTDTFVKLCGGPSHE